MDFCECLKIGDMSTTDFAALQARRGRSFLSDDKHLPNFFQLGTGMVQTAARDLHHGENEALLR